LSASSCQLASCGVGCQHSTKGESKMNATAALPVVGIDVANAVFQLAVTDGAWRVTEQHRLTRMQMERWFANRSVGLVVMEACGSAHHWGRWLNALGIEVRLLPALYVRAGRLGEPFGRVVFAQVRISALNTVFTGIYLVVLLPLFGVHLPLTKTLIGVTFVAGLLPVVGNLISNAVIVVVSLALSHYVAFASLVFLIVIHKLESLLSG